MSELKLIQEDICRYTRKSDQQSHLGVVYIYYIRTRSFTKHAYPVTIICFFFMNNEFIQIMIFGVSKYILSILNYRCLII